MLESVWKALQRSQKHKASLLHGQNLLRTLIIGKYCRPISHSCIPFNSTINIVKDQHIH